MTLGSVEVGTIKLSVEAHNVDANESVVDKLTSRTIDLLQKTVAGKLPKVSAPKSNVTKISYNVCIEKRAPESLEPKCYMLHDHKKYDENDIAIPLSSLARANLVLVTEAVEDAGSKSLANTPMKKKEKRRSLDALLAETLNWTTGGQDGGAEQQHREEVGAERLPWFKPLEIQQGNVTWTITLKGKLKSELDINWQRHFDKLYLAHLRLLNDAKRLTWNGELSPDLELLLNSTLPLMPDDMLESRTELKRRAFIKLHSKISFNCSLMYSSLAALSNNIMDLSSVNGSGDYVSYCVRRLIGMSFRSKRMRRDQAPLMAKSLDMICGDKVEELTSGVRGLLRSRLLVLLDGEQLVRYCRDHLLAVAKSLSSIESEWARALLELMADEVCEELKHRTRDLAEVDGVQHVYFSFLNVRDACRAVNMEESQVHLAIEPALLSLIDLVAAKAKEQVSIKNIIVKYAW